MEKKNKVLIIAHRGESLDAVENSLGSVKLAWERNADAVEVDVRLTKDDVIIAHHDVSIKRKGNKKLKITKHRSEHIFKVNIGQENSGNSGFEKIPTLKEILLTVPDGKILFIEIKPKKGVLKPLEDLLRNCKVPKGQIRFISFNFELLVLLKKHLPEYNYYLIYRHWLPVPFKVEKLISKVKDADLDGLDLHYKLINAEVIRKVKASGLEIFTWTVNDLKLAKQFVNWGIEGITTDRAGWMKRNLNS